MGWFYGMKLHLVIDSQGNLVDFCLSKGNKADLNCLERLSRNIKGLLFADKGYISNQKTEILEHF